MKNNAKKLTLKTANKNSIEKAIDELNASFPEREQITSSLIDALVSGEHVLLIGPAGTGKSAIVNAFSKMLGSKTFSYLLTRFTTPDEIFGPVSVAGLKQDKLRRVTTGRLPESEFAFLDEIFKANSAVLNSMLTALNERQFDDDGQRKSIPLKLCVGASNELPTGGDGLGALHDRFLFRFFVDYLQDANNVEKVLFQSLDEVKTKIKKSDLEAIKKAADDVVVPDDVVRAILLIRNKLPLIGVTVSDRRWKKIVQALKVKTARLGYSEVKSSFLVDVTNFVWERPEQIEEIKNVVEEYLPAGYREYMQTKNTVEEVLQTLKKAIARKQQNPNNKQIHDEVSPLIGSVTSTLNRAEKAMANVDVDDVQKKLVARRIAECEKAQKDLMHACIRRR